MIWILTHVIVSVLTSWATYWFFNRKYKIDRDILDWAKQIVADYRIQAMVEKDRRELSEKKSKDLEPQTSQISKARAQWNVGNGPDRSTVLQETSMKTVLSNANAPLTELPRVHDARSDEQIREYEEARHAHMKLQKMVG